MINDNNVYSFSKPPLKNNISVWNVLAILAYILTVVMAFEGYAKMNFYDPDSGINAYVGGDAYNYIINAQYATAYFILAGCSAIVGTLFLLINHIKEH